MGAAQGNLAGREIVEQSSCALHLCKVEFPGSYWAQAATLLRLNGMTGEFQDFLFSSAVGANNDKSKESRRISMAFSLRDAKQEPGTAAVKSFPSYPQVRYWL